MRHSSKAIVIEDRQAPNAKVRVAIHELAHALGSSSQRFGRQRPEVIVECAAFAVAASTFLVGTLLATDLKLRVIAVDANPDFGTLARLAPDDRRAERTLADLLADAERVNTAAELKRVRLEASKRASPARRATRR